MQDRLFQRNGRWKTVSAKNCYLEDSLDSKVVGFQNVGYLITELTFHFSLSLALLGHFVQQTD